MPDGNPASPHHEGRAARAALEDARRRAAEALGVKPRELVFTASGTEAVNLAMLGAARRNPGSVLSWAAEHNAVLGACRRLQLEGAQVRLLPVDELARNQSAPPGSTLISTSLANNEVGTVQPRIPAGGALLHLDACQGPQWLDVNLEGVALASFSGAKLGAGGGGLLFVRDGVLLEPLQYGGPQERGRRAGREDVRVACAMAVALEVCAGQRRERSSAIAPLGRVLNQALVAAGGRLTGAEDRIPGHSSAVFPGLRGEDLLLALDLAGLAASSGSACASGSLDPSHVLLAMGFSLEDSLASLRLSCGYETTAAEVEQAADLLTTVIGRLQAAHA